MITNHSAFDGVHRDRIDRQAALVFSGGVAYEPKCKVVNFHSDTQPELRKNVPKSINLAGIKFGRFTVVGLSKHKSGTWVVRCACGAYEDRKAKAIRNPENFGDRCTKCRAVAQERRSYEWHKNGVEIDWRTL